MNDGCKVHLRHLFRAPRSGEWRLSEPIIAEQVSQVHGGRQLAHVSWSPTGSDLAVVDVAGRVSVFTSPTSCDRLALLRNAALDPEDELCSVVGLSWLNSDRPDRSVCSPVPFTSSVD